MKRLRLDRWTAQLQPPRNPRLHLQRCPFSHETRAPRHIHAYMLQERQYHIQHQWQCQRRQLASRRQASSVAAVAEAEDVDFEAPAQTAEVADEQEVIRRPLYAPSHRKALSSAKLAALHARLSLPSKLPLQTLARCLIDPSADPRQGYNNAPFSVLGQDLLGYYTAEYLMCRYPRLPMPVLFAAQYAYVGSATLSAMRAEWGVETVAAPGQEVDPGLLQLKRMRAGNAMADGQTRREKDMPGARRLGSGRRNEQWSYRRGVSSRIVYDDEFGDMQMGLPPADSKPYEGAAISTMDAEDVAESTEQLQISDDAHDMSEPSLLQDQTPEDTEAVTVEVASAGFIRALAGALYLHAGAAASKSFHRDHVLSRQLQLHTLFHFTHPTRDLSRLCAREGFEPPVARLISETGRLSRTPVFVIGVYSGDNKLGEAAGASLNEGRVRAAAAALRSWYLYSPPESEVMLPSDVEGATAAAVAGGKGKEKKAWKPQMVDIGEVIT